MLNTRLSPFLIIAFVSLLLLAALIFWASHNRQIEPEFVVPDGAQVAFAAAKDCAISNGCVHPQVELMRLGADGHWHVTFECDGEYFVNVQVTKEGKVVWYTGHR
jgi:hypothetical protein